MALVLTAGDLAAIRQHALAAYPEECCGLLLGEAAWRKDVTKVLPVENHYAAPRRGFELAAGAVACALAQERRGGQAVVGVYHSHPDGAALPSRRDEREAWPGWSYLIVPVTDGGCGEPRAFRRDAAEGPLVEEPVEVVEATLA
ncbi:MAG TPA: M67 family metallopeptidase [Thermoanaerobaculia bacterium]|nr:M67 family metallopeptidase [Thermoanaerobaculia bacterium]